MFEGILLKKGHQNLIASIFWLMIGLLLSIWSTRYQVGGLLQPGPGFLPFGLGLALIFLSVFLFLREAREHPTTAHEAPIPSLARGRKKMAYTVLILLLVTFLFEKIGYLFTIFFFISSLMWGVTSRGWRTILLVALCSTLCIYFLFVLLLKQQLPIGPLGV
ncbi:MAG: tripartite tricarboxylate transporter TctB family protein [Thermodesulfobacteriota bacterium]